jgi:hypothetical protein
MPPSSFIVLRGPTHFEASSSRRLVRTPTTMLVPPSPAAGASPAGALSVGLGSGLASEAAPPVPVVPPVALAPPLPDELPPLPPDELPPVPVPEPPLPALVPPLPPLPLTAPPLPLDVPPVPSPPPPLPPGSLAAQPRVPKMKVAKARRASLLM